MSYEGEVRGGTIVLNPPAVLPEGAKVRVVLATAGQADDLEGPTLFEQFDGLIGKAEGLPSDLAANHDHYLHGLPKRQP